MLIAGHTRHQEVKIVLMPVSLRMIFPVWFDLTSRCITPDKGRGFYTKDWLQGTSWPRYDLIVNFSFIFHATRLVSYRKLCLYGQCESWWVIKTVNLCCLYSWIIPAYHILKQHSDAQPWHRYNCSGLTCLWMLCRISTSVGNKQSHSNTFSPIACAVHRRCCNHGPIPQQLGWHFRKVSVGTSKCVI